MKGSYIVASALAIALSGFVVAGCSSSDQDGQSVGVQETQQRETKESSASVFDLSGTIEPTVMLDNDIMTIEAKDLTYKNNVAYLTVGVTNKTASDIDVYAATLGFSGNFVNGCMVDDGYMNCSITAGETVDEEIDFNLKNLQVRGISGIEEIGLGLRVTDSNYDEIYRDIVSVSTSSKGKEKDRAFSDAISDPTIQKLAEFEVTPSSSSFNGVEWGGIAPVSACLVVNKDGEHSVMIEVENTSDGNASIVLSGITIDGAIAYESRWSSTAIAPSKRAVVYVTLERAIDDDQLESFDLSEIRNVSMDVSVEDFSGNTLAMPTSVDIAF